uniref:Aspartyl proteinase n=1 Tax=Ganoderma boninense TaxID=34458 RepID=A0A5K1K4U1_9APHY|nr:Aspartyl proteinase [Ganoderma boninense]
MAVGRKPRRPIPLADPTSGSEPHISSHPERSGPSPSSPPSPLPNSSPSVTILPLTALGRLAQSAVEALCTVFVEAYGFVDADLGAPAPIPICPSATDLEPPSKPPPQCIWDDPELSPKIRDACRVARENGYRYIWIDSCCIDKSSSSELSEAINSMYRWYALARVCYAYLADVRLEEDPHAGGSAFRQSRWFQRGWTLQELIAPAYVEFLSKDWSHIGSKHTLADLVEGITAIHYAALLRLKSLDSFSVAQRLSWAAERQTTRVEDKAYSLLGIFDINMQPLYGEGPRAFRRLQEQIMQRIPDQSLFAWGRVYLEPQFEERGPRDSVVSADDPVTLNDVALGRQCISAPVLYSFRGCRDIQRAKLPDSHQHEIVYTFTAHGIRTQFQMTPLTDDLISAIFPHHKLTVYLPHTDAGTRWYLAILGCGHPKRPGHLLGQVCYIPRPKSGIEFIYSGFITDPMTYDEAVFNLFALSPAIVAACRADTQLRTVYIRHPSRDTMLSALPYEPHAPVTLVLLRKTRTELLERGYTLDFHGPDADTHRLTLSKRERTVAVEIQHKFRHYRRGRAYITYLNGAVQMSSPQLSPGSPGRSDLQADAPDSESASSAARDTVGGGRWVAGARHTMGWSQIVTESFQVPMKLKRYQVRVGAPGARSVAVRLGLDVVGALVYILHVDILDDAVESSPSGVEVAVNQPGTGEGERTDEHSSSGAMIAEEAASGEARGEKPANACESAEENGASGV